MTTALAKFNRAILTATSYHASQVDKGGNAYILHPLQVMINAMFFARTQNYAPEVVLIVGTVAVLHDTVEDTSLTLEQVRAEFGDEVARSVDAITKRDGESKDDYNKRVTDDPIACLVKIFDTSDNARLDRLNRTPTKDDYDRQAYYMKRTALLAQVHAEQHHATYPLADTYANYLKAFEAGGDNPLDKPLPEDEWNKLWGRKHVEA